MRALILEDERRAAERLQRSIADIAPDIEVVAVFESVREGKEYLSDKLIQLDVIF